MGEPTTADAFIRRQLERIDAGLREAAEGRRELGLLLLTQDAGSVPTKTGGVIYRGREERSLLTTLEIAKAAGVNPSTVVRSRHPNVIADGGPTIPNCPRGKGYTYGDLARWHNALRRTEEGGEGYQLVRTALAEELVGDGGWDRDVEFVDGKPASGPHRPHVARKRAKGA